MIDALTERRMLVLGGTLIVPDSQRAEIERLLSGIGLSGDWSPSVGPIETYSDLAEGATGAPTVWCFSFAKASEAERLQAILDAME